MFNAFLLDSIDYVKLKWVDVISCHLEFDEQNTAIFSVSVPIHSALSTTRPRQIEKSETNVIHAAVSPVALLHGNAPSKKIYKPDAQRNIVILQTVVRPE